MEMRLEASPLLRINSFASFTFVPATSDEACSVRASNTNVCSHCVKARTLQSHDHGNLEGKLLRRFDDSLRDDVTTHDAAEDVDEDGLDLSRRQV